MRKISGIFLIFAILLSGCTSHIGNLTAASTVVYDTKNINEQHLKTKLARGTSSCYIIILFPTCAAPKLDEAISLALNNGQGDYMQNVQVYYTSWYIPYIVGKFSYVVVGDVYSTK